MSDNASDIKKIAIMGGTFDPIHYGHLIVAEAVRDEFDIDKILFIPSGNPPHKSDKKVTPANLRYTMTFLATMTNPHFEVSSLEIDRIGYSYTIDTIMQLKKFLKDSLIYFIVGADAINDIFTWKEPQKLFKLCKFIAVTRPGYNKEQLFLQVEEIKKKYDGKIYFFEPPSFDISSSNIRRRISDGDTIKYMLPEEVERYIYKLGLYKNY